MFLDVKELAVRKLRIRKTYAPGSIDFHSAEIKQVEPLEVVVVTRQVLRRKMLLCPFVWFNTRLVEVDANATN